MWINHGMNIIEYEFSMNVSNWLNMIYSIRIQLLSNLHLIKYILNPYLNVYYKTVIKII